MPIHYPHTNSRAGADLDRRDHMGRTPLWVAASTDGKLDFIKCLLEANANINVADAEEKSSPLQVSVSECVSLEA